MNSALLAAILVSLVVLLVLKGVEMYDFIRRRFWPRHPSDIPSGSPKARFEALSLRHVVVHTHGGHSLDGVLAGLYADGIELSSCSYLRPGEPEVPLAGNQILPWANIEWIQELPAAGVTSALAENA